MVKDNRWLIENLEDEGELVRVDEEVGWEGKPPTVFRKSHEEDGPAFLFENIKGFEGWRYLGAHMDTYKKAAISLDLNPSMHPRKISKELNKRFADRKEPVEVDADDAPVKANIQEDPNLLDLPAAMVHLGDGGRYLCTWHGFTTRHPEKDWLNTGMYRAQVLDETHLAGNVADASDQAKIIRANESNNEPTPFVCAIGPEPSLAICSASGVGEGVNECDVAGSLAEEPIEVVEAETNDLPVPANAEIVLEGKVLLDKRIPEGPFGEYSGYRGCPRGWRYLYEVDCVTYRDDPILTISDMGMPTDECDIIWTMGWEGSIQAELENKGVPVKDVHLPPELVAYVVVVQVEAAYPNIASTVKNIVWGMGPVQAYFNYLIVVPPDVDIYDMGEVMHTLFTRCDMTERQMIDERSFTSPLTTFIPYSQRQIKEGPKVTYDTIWPTDWDFEEDVPIKVTWENEEMYPKELQEEAKDVFEKYGVDEND